MESSDASSAHASSSQPPAAERPWRCARALPSSPAASRAAPASMTDAAALLLAASSGAASEPASAARMPRLLKRHSWALFNSWECYAELLAPLLTQNMLQQMLCHQAWR